MSELTQRQREIKTRLDLGLGAREIAEDLGITRNAVYQQIQRLRKHGELPHNYTPTGQPVRESRPGETVLAQLLDNMDGDEDGHAAAAGAAALVQELRRTRDDCERIVQRITGIIGR